MVKRKRSRNNHFFQKLPYTSGPATIRMILADMSIKASEEELIEYTGTNDKQFTRFENLIGCLAEKYKLCCQYGQNSSVEELEVYLKYGWSVIVAYQIGNNPHFSYFLGSNGNHIFLNDPMYGEKHTLTTAKFHRKWRITDKKFKHLNSINWYVAVQDKLPF